MQALAACDSLQFQEIRAGGRSTKQAHGIRTPGLGPARPPRQSNSPPEQVSPECQDTRAPLLRRAANITLSPTKISPPCAPPVGAQRHCAPCPHDSNVVHLLLR